MKKAILMGLMSLMSLRAEASPQTSDADLRAVQLPPLNVTGHVVDCQGLRVALTGSNDLASLTNAASVDLSGLSDLNFGTYNAVVSLAGIPIKNGDASTLFSSISAYGNNSISVLASGCGITTAANFTIFAPNFSLDFSNNQIPSMNLSSGSITFGSGSEFDFANNPTLTTITPGDGTTTGIISCTNDFIDLAGCALTNASEDALLASCVAMETANPGQSATLDISGGTSAVPDATGAGYITTLVGTGWTITTN